MDKGFDITTRNGKVSIHTRCHGCEDELTPDQARGLARRILDAADVAEAEGEGDDPRDP